MKYSNVGCPCVDELEHVHRHYQTWVRFAWVQATISAWKTWFRDTVHNTLPQKPTPLGRHLLWKMVSGNVHSTRFKTSREKRVHGGIAFDAATVRAFEMMVGREVFFKIQKLEHRAC